jgi:sulfur carrier protein
MELLVNGERKHVEAQSVESLLQELGIAELRCATMLNGKIVKRVDRASTSLGPNDQVEIISMVGGG